MADRDDQAPALDDPTIEAVFNRLTEAETAAAIAQRQFEISKSDIDVSERSPVELIEAARLSIALADDVMALASRWQF